MQLIVIPARYASSRFPGKPLVNIAGKTMIQRTYEVAKKLQDTSPSLRIIVATEDQRIKDHVESFGGEAALTSDTCLTGTDRVFEVASSLGEKPDFIINLQGDAPLTPPHILKAILDHLAENPFHKVATPVTQLSWEALDALRDAKKSAPFSGTTVIRAEDGRAIWFSKQILPMIRKEESLRKERSLSPVFRHIGLYGFRYEALQAFVTHKPTHYELLESLEQLRLLEMGIPIHTVKVSYAGYPSMQGIDTIHDKEIAERLLSAYEVTS